MSRFEVMQIGDERQSLVVIDGFAADPDTLRQAAAARPFEPARHAYPGLRAELPDDYWPQQSGVVREGMAMIGLAGPATLIDTSFSIVTTPRDALAISQRLPHCDSHDPARLAFVHYLDLSEASGGTAFFRHRSTRFETVDTVRAPIYDGQLEAELRHGRPPPPEYIGADSRLFEMLAAIPARYNRAVLYRSFALHSGIIPPSAALGSDPLAGRLTVTGFLSLP